MPEYTAISFAPVQGFIEKSRKLRDLYGSSGILSYLSHQLIQKAVEKLGDESVISPGLINVQKGMPNRILIHGEFSRDEAKKTVLDAWQLVLNVCREWVEKKVPAKEKYHWEQEWIRWGLYSWEIFWGHGKDPEAAMKDLETRKLRRDWTAINWMGESSSLTGTDAIAWTRLGLEDSNPGLRLTKEEKEELDDFYNRLSRILEDCPPDEEPKGKFLAPNERLSVPELVKRLVTRDAIAKETGAWIFLDFWCKWYRKIQNELPVEAEKLDLWFMSLVYLLVYGKVGITKLEQGFTEIHRNTREGTGQWTGWFMGDGDEVGKKIKDIYRETKEQQGEEAAEAALKYFTHAMRDWGKKFYDEFPNKNLGQVIYAGGDDFLGVIYSRDSKKSISPLQALDWLIALPNQWKNLHDDLQNRLNIENHLNIDMTFSVGFVWAAPSVPQRDILQHCREAEKRAKNLGRDRVTIRVVFNSGQYVQWTCPWDYLDILTKYCDRDGNTWGQNPNWTHIYNDWAQLKARHAIRLKEMEGIPIKKQIALAIFDLYFNDTGKTFSQERRWDDIAGGYTDVAIVNWINDLIQVGWQLCQTNSSNS